MDIFDQIIKNLELERELGTRTVEIDRALLVPPEPELVEAPPPKAAPKPQPQPETMPAPKSDMRDVAFLTGRPLSPGGAALLDKMIAAMKLTRDRVFVNEQGRAKVLVLMGSAAQRQHAPNVRTVRGKWFRLDGVPAVMTFSPDFLLEHFADGSPEMKAAKLEVWGVLQAVMRNLTP